MWNLTGIWNRNVLDEIHKMPGTTATSFLGVSCMTCLAKIVSTYLKHELGKPL